LQQIKRFIRDDASPIRVIRHDRGAQVSIILYVEDVDAMFAEALEAGAKVLEEMSVKDQFHGDCTGSMTDPSGNKWSIMTHIEDVSFERSAKKVECDVQIVVD
jgi:PhnB protein